MKWPRLQRGTARRRPPLSAVSIALVGLAVGATAGLGQSCDPPADGVRVIGAVDSAVVLTAAELAAMPRVSANIEERDGSVARYEGVTLREVLDRAGVPGGSTLHGRALSAYVVVEARDGYRATFALAELDEPYWQTRPFLADRRDGQVLPDPLGPYQVLVPDTPQRGRWVRQVACLRVAYPDDG